MSGQFETVEDVIGNCECSDCASKSDEIHAEFTCDCASCEPRGNPPDRSAARNNAKTRISLERDRQIELWGNGPMPIGMRLAVLVEEVGEVAKAMQDETDRELLAELSQVAAVALRWMEDLLLEMER